jgi:type IV secretory pathway VirB3-like protein
MKPTLREALIQDMQNMETGMERTANGRGEIWQNNLIYVICLAVFHIIEYIIRKEDKQNAGR